MQTNITYFCGFNYQRFNSIVKQKNKLILKK